ncbi:MAG: terpene cyclase/mutase family protein [Bacteroidota bacterium]
MESAEKIEETIKTKASKKESFWSDWILKTENGRQRWFFKSSEKVDSKYLNQIRQAFSFDKTKNSNSGDLVYRFEKKSVESVEVPSWMNESINFSNGRIQRAVKSAFKGIHFYSRLQTEDGNWPGDYGGPMFLLPALIITSYITKKPFSKEKQALMIQYMLNHQNKDGGWGLHIEGNSTMFGTVLQYCALRLLEVDANNSNVRKARQWILENGGATNTPSWGKFFMAVLGIYEWKGCNSLMPELWLLPKWVGMHPWRYWCHARMVYLPMSYCFGKKVVGEITPLVKELREEIYTENYDKIDWAKSRNKISEHDRFKPAPKGLKVLLSILNFYEKIALSFIRKKSVSFAIDYVNAEDKQTNFIDIGPVNQIINSLCVWDAYGKDSEPFKKHVERWDDYLWLAEDGMKMNGYNGSQLWDTAFAVQAMHENRSEVQNEEALQKAYSYIDYTQIKDEVEDREKYFRHASVGGWPFSTLDHGWPIADCTAEGLKATISLHDRHIPELNDLPKIPEERLKQAVDLILSFQNNDGGWATYENTRGGSWLEYMNPSEVFGKIMVDYSWVECTSACVTALLDYSKTNQSYRKKDIDKAVNHGIEFIKNLQRTDGSWVGNWGVCFTYGTWFAIEALVKSGEQQYDSETEASDAIKRGCEFLVAQQHPDGGWGESYLSCVNDRYEDDEKSNVVNTSWTLLSLMMANYPNKDVVDRGIDYLVAKQYESGDWPQQSISGVFNQNCMITYTAYRNIFPIWAIGRYTKTYCKKMRYRGNSKH